MRERPILFRPALVRAILNGEKTQTRRVAKRVMVHHTHDEGRRFCSGPACSIGNDRAPGAPINDVGSPYGVVGDKLWVRESGYIDRDEKRFFVYEATPNQCITPDDRGLPFTTDRTTAPPKDAYKRVPSIHMPRWACRIVLEVTDVRLQRLQETSGEDALAEGTWVEPCPTGVTPELAREIFSESWGRINAERGYAWDTNPYVWAITFRRVTA